MAPEFAFDGFSTTAIIGSAMLTLFSVTVGALARFRGAAIHYVMFGAGFGLAAGLAHLVGAMERALGYGLNDSIPPELYTAEMVAWATGIFAIAAAIALVAISGAVGLMRHYGGFNVHLVLAGAALAALQTAVLFMRLSPGASAWPLPFAAFEFAFEWAIVGLGAIMAMGSVAMAAAYVRDGKINQAILGAALGAYTVLDGIWTFVGVKIGGAPMAWFVWLPLILTAAIIGAWLHAARKSKSPAARNVLWFFVAATIFAITMSPFPQALHMGGLARAIDVVLVAYAILRHQYLDLDVKLRWTISKTTLAGIFVAVFFVVSEGAAALFSEQWGTGIGIAAAGLLVFGIAPLMRIADRFAATAVPVRTHPEQIFAAAVRAALADGRISGKEEAHLAEVAEGLGLTPTRMAAIRHNAGNP